MHLDDILERKKVTGRELLKRTVVIDSLLQQTLVLWARDSAGHIQRWKSDFGEEAEKKRGMQTITVLKYKLAN